jgi:hypothetical protein
MTSGGLYLEGCAGLDDPQVLMKVQEKADAKLAVKSQGKQQGIMRKRRKYLMTP